MATLRIIQDETAESPRSWCNIGIMACWNNRYKLGDVQPRCTAEEWLKENAPEGSVVMSLYLYDHSGITMRTSPFTCPWDSGQVGWIVATPDVIRKEYNCKRISKRTRERVENCLIGEVAVYDQYLRAACWGYVFTHDDGEEYSCWGYFGDSLDESGLKDAVPTDAVPLLEDAWESRQ